MLDNIRPEDIKPTYSKEVIQILDDVRVEELIKDCHNLRSKFPNLKESSNIELMILALKMYKRHKERVLKNKLKRVKNG